MTANQNNGTKVRIAGTASFCPQKVLTNSDLAKTVDTSDDWITQRTGIKERRIADENTFPSDLGAAAAKKVLVETGTNPLDIELILVGTSNPDRLLPTTACYIQEKLGCKNAGAVDMLAACSGFVYAFSSGVQFVRTGRYKKVLVIGTETLSKMTNYQDRTTCVLFGDAAGAALLEPSNGESDILYTELGADGTLADLIIVPAGCTRMPLTKEILDQNLHLIHMKGREVYKFAVIKLEELCKRALEKSNLTISSLSLFIPHQMNIRIIESVAQKMNIPESKVFINIHKYGNTSSASIPVALDEAIRSGKIKRGDTVLMVALGGGLTWGTILIKF